MNDQRFWQIHLGTAFILMILAAVMVAGGVRLKASMDSDWLLFLYIFNCACLLIACWWGIEDLDHWRSKP